MSDIAIRVENLGKKYTIGANQARYQTIRESLSNAFHQSFRSRKGQISSEENTIWALKDVNFEVKHGEVLGIIGRNGAGKSTLLKILARITKPTTGRIELNGRVGSLLEVGTGFHPELTGRENIYLSGAILGMKRQEIIRKFDEIVDFAEIEKFLDTPVKHYSSGMYMRLAFAVAAHLEPEILLVDEVLAVGDAAFQRKCLEFMNQISKKGKTIFLVTHNMAIINFLCTVSIVLENGHIKLKDIPTKAIDFYASRKSLDQYNGKLSIFENRRGSGHARFDLIQTLDSKNQSNNVFFMGDSISFKLKLNVFQRIKMPVVGILFKDSFGNTLIRAYSQESNSNTPSFNKNLTIICKYNSIPFMYGNYFIDLWLSDNEEVIDYVENATQISVEKSDVYHTGNFPDKNNGGVFYAPHEWEFVL